MIGVTPDDGSRRRLPQWMLGISSGVQVTKPGNVKGNDKQLEEGTQPHENETLGENSHVLVKCETKRRKRKSTEQDADPEGDVLETVPEKKRNACGRRKVQEPAAPKRQKAKDPGEGIQVHEKELLGEDSHFLTKCETKRRKRKSDEQDAECDGISTETFAEKKYKGRRRRKVQESDAPKRQKEKGSSCGSEEQEVRTSTDDDVELTVEDLVIIAEEYTEADRNMKREAASNQECESNRRLAERVCSGNVLEDSVDPQNCSQGSLIPDTTTSKLNGSLTSTETSFNSSGTGDPAQDMLDLFLGPLLMKTVEKETKEDTKTQFLTENVTFSQEFKRQCESKVVREEIPPAPVVKKKSSLRDKVAMFLD